MTEAALPGYITKGDFRIGHVLSRAAHIFSRNFPTYFVVAATAGLPPLLIGVLVPTSPVTAANPLQNAGAGGFTLLLTIVFWLLSQAIVVYGVFQGMRGRPIRLADCLKVGLRRFFSLIGLATCVGIAMLVYMVFWAFAIVWLASLPQTFQMKLAVVLATVLLLLPLIGLFLTWFVATPACVVERLGPFRSMGRSRALTKGHRWKIFGLILAVLIPALIVAAVITAVMAKLGIGVNLRIGVFFDLNKSLNSMPGQIVSLIWTATWTAFYAVLVTVVYHDLRVAKEGVDTEQIAAVFE
jgi:hypothetical protein